MFFFVYKCLFPEWGVLVFTSSSSIRSNSILSYIMNLYFFTSLPCMWGERLDHYTTRLMKVSEMLPSNHGGISEFYPFFSQRELNEIIMHISCLTFSLYVSTAELVIGLSCNLAKNFEENFILNVVFCWDNQA